MAQDKQQEFKKLVDEVKETCYSGSLHVVINDLNVEDGFINATIDECEKAIKLCNFLLSFSEEERRELINNYYSN